MKAAAAVGRVHGKINKGPVRLESTTGTIGSPLIGPFSGGGIIWSRPAAITGCTGAEAGTPAPGLPLEGAMPGGRAGGPGGGRVEAGADAAAGACTGAEAAGIAGAGDNGCAAAWRCGEG